MQPVAQTSMPKSESVQLKQPPKWLRRPCGANFGFGGKLVTFEALPKQPNETGQKSVLKLASVVTELGLVQRSTRLETSLQNDNMTEYCELKVSDSSKKENQEVWRFIKANFEQDPRKAFLTLLEYEPNSVRNMVSIKRKKRTKAVILKCANGANGANEAQITQMLLKSANAFALGY
jgi:protein transport protein SEC31